MSKVVDFYLLPKIWAVSIDKSNVIQETAEATGDQV